MGIKWKGHRVRGHESFQACIIDTSDEMSALMCAQYGLSSTVWWMSGSQICEILKIKKVNSKKNVDF